MGKGVIFDPEALARGYRYFRALELQRRGYVLIRDMIRDFLVSRRWALQRPNEIEGAALALVDALYEAGALATYQVGVRDDNWAEHERRHGARAARERAEAIAGAVAEARADERRRVDERLVELEREREGERYSAKLAGELARETKRSAEAPRGASRPATEATGAVDAGVKLKPVKPRRRRRR